MDICAWIIPYHMMLAKWRIIEVEMRMNIIDSCIKVKDKKLKVRPFAEGSRGCHALFIVGCTSS